MTTWYAPAPGTTAHRIRTGVRAALWGAVPAAALVLCDPAVRATLGLPA